MLTRIIISARLNETKDKISLLKDMVSKARKLKGQDISTLILEWVLADGA